MTTVTEVTSEIQHVGDRVHPIWGDGHHGLDCISASSTLYAITSGSPSSFDVTYLDIVSNRGSDGTRSILHSFSSAVMQPLNSEFGSFEHIPRSGVFTLVPEAAGDNVAAFGRELGRVRSSLEVFDRTARGHLRSVPSFSRRINDKVMEQVLEKPMHTVLVSRSNLLNPSSEPIMTSGRRGVLTYIDTEPQSGSLPTPVLAKTDALVSVNDPNVPYAVKTTRSLPHVVSVGKLENDAVMSLGGEDHSGLPIGQVATLSNLDIPFPPMDTREPAYKQEAALFRSHAFSGRRRASALKTVRESILRSLHSVSDSEGAVIHVAHPKSEEANTMAVSVHAETATYPFNSDDMSIGRTIVTLRVNYVKPDSYEKSDTALMAKRDDGVSVSLGTGISLIIPCDAELDKSGSIPVSKLTFGTKVFTVIVHGLGQDSEIVNSPPYRGVTYSEGVSNVAVDLATGIGTYPSNVKPVIVETPFDETGDASGGTISIHPSRGGFIGGPYSRSDRDLITCRAALSDLDTGLPHYPTGNTRDDIACYPVPVYDMNGELLGIGRTYETEFLPDGTPSIRVKQPGVLRTNRVGPELQIVANMFKRLEKTESGREQSDQITNLTRDLFASIHFDRIVNAFSDKKPREQALIISSGLQLPITDDIGVCRKNFINEVGNHLYVTLLHCLRYGVWEESDKKVFGRGISLESSKYAGFEHDDLLKAKILQCILPLVCHVQMRVDPHSSSRNTLPGYDLGQSRAVASLITLNGLNADPRYHQVTEIDLNTVQLFREQIRRLMNTQLLPDGHILAQMLSKTGNANDISRMTRDRGSIVGRLYIPSASIEDAGTYSHVIRSEDMGEFSLDPIIMGMHQLWKRRSADKNFNGTLYLYRRQFAILMFAMKDGKVACLVSTNPRPSRVIQSRGRQNAQPVIIEGKGSDTTPQVIERVAYQQTALL